MGPKQPQSVEGHDKRSSGICGDGHPEIGQTKDRHSREEHFDRKR